MENEMIEKEEAVTFESNFQPAYEVTEQKMKSNKKKFVRILIPIPVVFFLIVLVLGIVSFVNYNANKPYKAIMDKLNSAEFIYYEEYEELSHFSFSEYDEDLNFFEKLLNIRKVYKVRLTPHIYFLYDKDSVEDNEALYDLIEEEEDEEIYNDLSGCCELVIEENGDTKLVCGDEILFNINVDNDKNIVSVTYNEDKKEYRNGSIDKELGDKYASIVNEYADYIARDANSSEVLAAARYAPLYYQGNRLDSTISDFVSKRVRNPEITIGAHRWDETVYCITVKGDCRYNSYYNEATVEFYYYSDENGCRVARDPQEAFTWYIYEEFPSYAYFPMW